MPGVAGEVKVIFKADTQSYTASVKAAKQELGVFEQSATSAGKVARQSFSDARGGVMVLGEEIGVHLPRHVQAFVAKLPGVASAMSAAFSTIAVFAIGKALFEAGEKIYEFAKKNEEAAAKNAAAWKAIEGPLHQTNAELAIANSKLQDSIDELSKKPGDGMKTALLEVADAAQKLAEKLDADIQKMQELAKGGSMQAVTSLFTGKAPSDQLDRMIGFLGKTFQNTTAGYEDVKGLAAQSGDWQNYKAQSQLEVNALQEKLGPTFDSLREYIRNQENAQGADPYGPDRSANIAKAKSAFDVITNAVLAIAQEADRAAGTIDQTRLHASLAAASHAAALPAGYDSRASNMSRIPGAAAWSDWLQAAAMQEALDAQKGQTLGGSGTFAAYSHLWPETNPNVTLGNTAAIGGFGIGGSSAASASRFGDEFEKRMQETIKQFTDLDDILANLTIRTLESFNETLIKVLSTPESMLRGKHPWRQLGASTAESAGSAALKYGEGAAMKELGNIPGIGKFFKATHKPTGSESDPIWVKLVDGGAGPMSSSMGNVGSSIISSLFGGGGASGAGAGMGSAGASLISSLFSGGGGAAATGAGSALGAVGAGIAGFAEGGMIPSNVPSIVGEKGPELFVPSTSGRIAPNGSFGGAPVINIDNRGVNDPAASAAAIHRAMAVYLPHIGNMAMSASRDNRRRVPLSKARG